MRGIVTLCWCTLSKQCARLSLKAAIFIHTVFLILTCIFTRGFEPYVEYAITCLLNTVACWLGEDSVELYQFAFVKHSVHTVVQHCYFVHGKNHNFSNKVTIYYVYIKKIGWINLCCAEYLCLLELYNKMFSKKGLHSSVC